MTILFCDLVGFTSLGEQEDPEAVRRTMGRYFEAARAECERHGGTVEKYIGDAVMAVFGIPQLHEDDALRAVRAAVNIRERVTGLGSELREQLGRSLQVRIGVNTGEVVATDSEPGHGFVTGDPVNVAARLQQSAEPGEIVLGEQTYELVRDVATAQPSGALMLKGKLSATAAWRLVDIKPLAPAIQRQPSSGLVGRRDELGVLTQVLNRSAESRSCQLATIAGEPGIGKSRLARELIDIAGGNARVVVGRCLSYGEGITFWPLVEIVRELSSAGHDLERLMAGNEDAELIAERVRGAVGIGDWRGPAEETAWAFRQLFESVAREKQLIVVIDDIHWAEPTLLDLLAHVVDHATGAAIVMLCLTRPELFERRPSWTTRDNSTVLSLRPLENTDAAELVETLTFRGKLSPSDRDRLIAAAEGNPLYIEQIVAHTSELGSTVIVPPSVEALLAARIDALEPGERAVIVRAAVEGRDFHRGAVVELSAGGSDDVLDQALAALVRKELIAPGRPQFAGEIGFRFGHQLIRDAAYGAASKDLRSNLHRRYAEWLERQASGRTTEYEEIIGYHLEQASRFLTELRQPDMELAERAALRLANAGERALSRADAAAARNLLERAVQLYGEATPANIWCSLGVALMQSGELPSADEALQTAEARAHALSDVRTAGRVAMERVALSTWTGDLEPGVIMSQAKRVIATLEPIGDDLGLAKAWLNIVQVHNLRLELGELERAAARALEHARLASSSADEAQAMSWQCGAMLLGVKPVSEAIQTCRDMLARARGPLAEAAVLQVLGPLSMMAGDVTEGRALFARAEQIHLDLGMRFVVALWKTARSLGELGAAHFSAAEEVLRSQLQTLEEMGLTSGLSTSAALLAHALCAQRRFDDAVPFLKKSAQMTGSDDRIDDILIPAAWARVHAAAGETKAAVDAGRRAVKTADRTDCVDMQALARIAMSEAYRAAGSPEEEAIVLRGALSRYQWRGTVAMVALVRQRLREVEPAATS